MKKLIVLVYNILILSLFAYSFTKESASGFWEWLQKDVYWQAGRSSVLIEKGYSAREYEWEKIRDKNLATAWVEGDNNAGIDAWIIIPINGDYQYLGYEHDILKKRINITLTINNGFCKNEIVFKNNNRVKKAKITIYEVPLCAYEDFRGTQAIGEPWISYETEIELEDRMDEQKFNFIFNPKAPYKEGSLYLFLKLTILDAYPGKKYNDTCISELHATADVIKEKKPEVTKQKKSFFRKDKE